MHSKWFVAISRFRGYCTKRPQDVTVKTDGVMIVPFTRHGYSSFVWAVSLFRRFLAKQNGGTGIYDRLALRESQEPDHDTFAISSHSQELRPQDKKQ